MYTSVGKNFLFAQKIINILGKLTVIIIFVEINKVITYNIIVYV